MIYKKITQSMKSIVVCTVFVLAGFSFATDVYGFAGGDGTSGSPYLIANCTDLQNMDNNVTAHYALARDIDCSDIASFTSIGQSTQFTGTLDGRNRTISNLTITGSYNQVGLFRFTGPDAVIENFTLRNASITGWSFVAGIVGFAGGGTISNVTVASSTLSGAGFTGGMVGAWWNNDNTSPSTLTISNSYVDASTTITSSASRVGGLIGDIDQGSGGTMDTIIDKSYFAGTISASGLSMVGGLIGMNYNASNELLYISNSFAAPTIDAGSYGGLVGYQYNGGSAYTTIDNSAFDAMGNGGAYCVRDGSGNVSFVGCEEVNGGGTDTTHFQNNHTVSPLSVWDFNTIWQTTSTYPTQRYPTLAPQITSVTIKNQLVTVTFDKNILDTSLSSYNFYLHVNSSTEYPDGTSFVISGNTLTMDRVYGPTVQGDTGTFDYLDVNDGKISSTNGDQMSAVYGIPLTNLTVPAAASRSHGSFNRIVGGIGGNLRTNVWISTPTSTAPLATVFTPATSVSISNASTTAEEASLVVTTPAPAQVYYFAKDLTFGDVGVDVLELQKYLNSHGFIVSISGPGSVGNETTKFGPATKAALIKFQKSKLITPAIGNFGPKTRSVVNAR